jgi:glycerol-3-phosphate cytidylyltransferase
MKRILTYGTFDCFHYGHFNILKRCADLGNKLYVGVSSDDFNALKNKSAVFDQNQRMEILRSLRFVDTVFLESSWEQKTVDIVNYRIDLFVIGDDWVGNFDYLRDFCEVMYLPRTEGISSSLIRGILG